MEERYFKLTIKGVECKFSCIKKEVEVTMKKESDCWDICNCENGHFITMSF